MAALTSSGVTLNEAFKEGRTSTHYRKVCDVTLVLSSQGGLTNNIPGSLFGLFRITRAYSFRDASSVAVSAGPSFDGTNLVFYTVETNGNPADQTGTFKGIIEGTE